MGTQLRRQAVELLSRFKGDRYVFGLDCSGQLGKLTAGLGRRAAVVSSGVGKAWAAEMHDSARRSLADAGVQMTGQLIAGARPNAPSEDVFSLAAILREARPDVLVAMGGGSVIDAAKAAVLAAFGDRACNLEDYFGMGKVTALLKEAGQKILPVVAVQLAASSAAHLTKYSNITDLASCQKKLIIDEALVPPRALFDYRSSVSMSPEFTADGALDGLSHCLEVFFGAKDEALARVRPAALAGIELIIAHVREAWHDGGNLSAREALGLGTDLGGYAIMIGGTSGAHLTSFSLVDVLTHGRACALMNPYYTVFFAPAIEPQLRDVAALFRRGGYLREPTDHLHARDLGLAVAHAMIALSTEIHFPTRLADVPGFEEAHNRRALAAAKNPQLDSKLKNMPVPMSAATVDEYMGPVLEAARVGDFSLIRNMKG